MALEDQVNETRERVQALRDRLATDAIRRAGIEPDSGAWKLVAERYDGEPLHTLDRTDGPAAVRQFLAGYGLAEGASDE